MKTLKFLVFGFSYLLCPMLVCQPASAVDPDITQWSLPKDAIARFGKGSITDAAYSPNGTHLAIRGSFATWIYDARTGEVLKMFPNQSEYYHSGDLAFSSNSNTLAVGMLRGIDLWDVTNGNYMKTLEAPESGITLSLAFLPVSFELASGHSDGTVKVWNTNRNEIYKTFTVNSNPTAKFLLDVSYVFQGQYLAATQEDGTVHLWHTEPQKVKTTKEDGTAVQSMTGPYQPVGKYSVAPATFFPEPPPSLLNRTLRERYGNLNQRGSPWVLPGNPIGVYIDDSTNSLGFFDPDTIQIIREVHPFYFPGPIYADYDRGDGPFGNIAMRYLPDEEMLLIWSGLGGTVFGINLPTGEWARLADLSPDGFFVLGLSKSSVDEEAPPEGRLIVYQADSAWHIMDRGTEGNALYGGTIISMLDNPSDIEDLYRISFEFSPDLTTIVGWNDGYWKGYNGWLWDVATGKDIGELKAHTTEVNGVTFSPDGTRVAVAAGSKIFFWDVATREIIKIIDLLEHVERVGGSSGKISISFSPDGGTLLSAGGTSHHVFLWDVATGKKIASYKSGVNVISISYSPDGDRFVTGSTDGNVVLWEADTGTNIRTIEAHTGPVKSISWSKDGNFFVTAGGYDRIVRRWNKDGEPAAGPNIMEVGEFESAYSVSYSPCGTEVAVGTHATILIWELGMTDVNRDGTTDMADVQLVSEHLRKNTLGGDVNADGEVNIVDLVVTMKQRDDEDEKTEIAENVKVLPAEERWDHGHKIAYAPDGQTIASIGTVSQPVVWDVATGIRLKSLGSGNHGHGQHIDAAAIISYSPDGNTLATGSADGTVLLWDVSQKLLPKGPGNFSDVSSFPDAPIVQYYPAAKSSEPIGTEFTVTLSMTDGLPISITGYEVDLQFDSKVLRYVESANGDYLPEDTFVVPTIVNKNQLKLAAASGSGVNRGSGILASVTFEVLSNKPDPLKLLNVRLTQGVCLIYPEVKGPPRRTPVSDVNGDGTVNIQDLVQVSANIGATGKNRADVNGDGVVNIQDLVAVAAAFGEAAAAPAAHTTIVENLTATEVAQWLKAAQQANRTDPAFQRGVEVLKHLLALLVPKETVLLANYPNPFNPETWIPYQLADPAEVTLRIHAVDGSLVRTLSLGYKEVGIYQTRSRAAYWDGKNEVGEPVASGVYFYTLTAGDFTATRRMLILK